ncbi:MAG: PAS domain S-box protein [Syntrophales bacterium]|nr:PAS domain S-box protein [Syntrophales bacterium]MDD5641494.1 PAS domain S-box protein [Syntrophales bacterium]
MKDAEKSKEQLLKELKELRNKVARLEMIKDCLENVLENSPDAIGIVDRRGRLLKWNKFAEKLFGYSFNEIKKKKVFEFYEDPQELSNMLKLLRNNEVVKEYEIKMRKKNGQVIVFNISIGLLKDSNNQLIGSVGVARDMTEKKEAEEELRKYRQQLEEMVEKRTSQLSQANAKLQKEITERKSADEALKSSEERYRSLFDGIPVGLYRTTPDGKIVDINLALVQMLGYPDRQSLLAVNVTESYVHPEDRDKKKAVLEGEGIIRDFEIELRRYDGKKIWVRDSVRVVREADSGAAYYEGSMEEITEKKQLESQYRQAQKMEAVGRLAGGVAHDFNNLLTAITGYGEITLMELRRDDPLRLNVEEILRAADSATSLTQQLLAFSRKQILQPRGVNLNETLTDMQGMLQRLIGEDIELILGLEPELGTVTADPNQIEQIVMNLAVNARDVMPQGGKIILETGNVFLDEAYTQRHLEVSPGPYVMLAVSDNGLGMDEETQNHIFEPFFTTKELGKGTGLGLATVYGIVKQSGGHIWVYSEPGHGTTFKFYLPRADAAVEAVKAEKLAELPYGEETILVVEDEDALRALICRALKKFGYKTLEARHGGEALLICEEGPDPIHLMLVDVVLPQMSGPKIAARMAHLQPEMKVLFMSGYTEDAMVHHGLLDQSVPFLQKPFKPVTMVRKVREVLDAQE